MSARAAVTEWRGREEQSRVDAMEAAEAHRAQYSLTSYEEREVHARNHPNAGARSSKANKMIEDEAIGFLRHTMHELTVHEDII